MSGALFIMHFYTSTPDADTINNTISNNINSFITNTTSSPPNTASLTLKPLIKPSPSANPLCKDNKYIYEQCTAKVATKNLHQPTSKHGDIYWLKNWDLVEFVNKTLHKIQHYFTIVYVTDLDIHTPLFWDTSEDHLGIIDPIINHPYLLCFFAENYDATINELKHGDNYVFHPYPIGFDFHSGVKDHGYFEQQENFENIVDNKMTPFDDKHRKFKIYVDTMLGYGYPSYLKQWDGMFGRHWTSNKNYSTKRSNSSHEIIKLYHLEHHWIKKRYYRNWVIWNIKENKNVNGDLFYIDDRMWSKYDGFKRRSEFIFSLSLFGNGMDCHRTWEALLASTIVIVQTSPLDLLYKNHDLPVVIIDSWEDINQTMLEYWYKKYKDKVYLKNKETRYKLTNDYWVKYVEKKTQETLGKVLPTRKLVN